MCKYYVCQLVAHYRKVDLPDPIFKIFLIISKNTCFKIPINYYPFRAFTFVLMDFSILAPIWIFRAPVLNFILKSKISTILKSFNEFVFISSLFLLITSIGFSREKKLGDTNDMHSKFKHLVVDKSKSERLLEVKILILISFFV